MVDLLTRYLKQSVGATPDTVATITAAFSSLTVLRHDILLAKEQTCQHVYFVNRGCVRAFFLQPDGVESTRYVAFEGQFITALSSFINRQPSTESLQALEDSHLLRLAYADFHYLLVTEPVREKAYRHQLEGAYLINTWRLESFITMDAWERYDFLLQTNPQLIRRLSNRLVASYLGIT